MHSQLNWHEDWRRGMAEKYGQLEYANIDLQQQYDDLRRRYTKKVESYKELDKNYMDLVRPLQVTGDDQSTVYSRLMHVRVSIEGLVQKAKGDRSANMKKEAAIEHFRDSGLLKEFPVQEAHLDYYHLNFYMESAIMTTLVARFFSRPLECIFDQSKEFEGIREWVDRQDRKIAARWRQQLCILIAKDVKAMDGRREEEVSKAAEELECLVSRVYPNVDMSAKIKELCYKTFDLSYAMFGMESMVRPVSPRLGTPFNETDMTTPQKSNSRGSVSLVIFPTFQDDGGGFHFKAKVWCA
ncbi:hypothetical protein BGX28_005001 [Mortierella sp. GBA30]|nr:hypothetical protein BGX28_005001 [Mortierella sp. GBA30]